MLFSKKRLFHALAYEGILLALMAVSLVLIFKIPLTSAGALGVFMAVIAVLWNMVFNGQFERLEQKFNLERTLKLRIFHALGFEGGLLLITIPIIAYMLDISLWRAFVLDIGLSLCVLFYTFIFQWCWDSLEKKYGFFEKELTPNKNAA